MGNLRPSLVTTVTLVASGRSARTVTPSGPGWAPRMECGSWWCPATMRSISSTLIWGMQGWLLRRGAGGGLAGAAARPGGCPSRGGPERIERYGQPGWPVPGLVHHLVDRLVQLEGAQRRLVTARVAPAGLSVALAECRAVALRP